MKWNGGPRKGSEESSLFSRPIFSWEEQEFVAGYASKAPPAFASRSPIERAILGFVEPKLLTTEREFLQMNSFRVAFGAFDWTLNDLTGRGGR